MRARTPPSFLASYAYWAILLFVAAASTAIPFLGETMLIAASIYAGATHRLDIALVIAASRCHQQRTVLPTAIRRRRVLDRLWSVPSRSDWLP